MAAGGNCRHADRACRWRRPCPRAALFYPLTSAFVEVFRNTPVLIQLIWFYYAFPVLVGIQFSTLAPPRWR
jgi:ABC-type amino acid transport system permease subunit